MKKASLLSFSIILLLLSCSAPEIDKNLLEDMLFKQEKGIIAGASIGDTWEEIKSNIHPDWEVNDTEKRISKTYDDLNFVTMSFDFYDSDKCNGLGVSISAEKGNHLTLAQLEKSLKIHLDTTLPLDKYGKWAYIDKAGNEYSSNYNFNTSSENLKSINFDLFKM